jgi:hypothetical protein
LKKSPFRAGHKIALSSRRLKVAVVSSFRGCKKTLSASELAVVAKVQSKSDHRYKGSRLYKTGFEYGPFLLSQRGATPVAGQLSRFQALRKARLF